ncbi:MAG: hypothetical protein KDA79_06865, partial [Planctomycetaceae bacterium]|nr:hypothetical protein [Planctomycetaceae bacterium]
LPPGRSQVNLISQRKREHSRKPVEMYDLIEECSPGPCLELFAREPRTGWTQWGDQLESWLEERTVRRGYTPLEEQNSPEATTGTS